jgi:hypothetical protein
MTKTFDVCKSLRGLSYFQFRLPVNDRIGILENRTRIFRLRWSRGIGKAEALNVCFSESAQSQVESGKIGRRPGQLGLGPRVRQTARLELPLILVLQVFEPLARVAETDLRDHGPDLPMIGREMKMDLEEAEGRIRKKADFVGRKNLSVEEADSGLRHFADAGRIVIGEIEEEKELAVQPRGRRWGRGGRGRGLPLRRLSGGGKGKGVFLEFGEPHLPAVVCEAKILPAQVGHRVALLVRHDDLDELEGDADLVLDGFLRPGGILLETARRYGRR